MSIFIPNVIANDVTYNNIRDELHTPLVNARHLCEKLWEKFEPFADSDFKKELMNDFDARFWEMDLTCFLIDQGFHVSSNAHGPDINIHRLKSTIHLEAVCPKSGQGKNEIPEICANNEIQILPDNEITLRLTSAILSKKRVYEKYLEEQIVGSHDCLIIAINSCQLDGTHIDFPVPRIIRALFPVGHQIIRKNLRAGKIDTSLEYSDSIINANGSPVPTNVFFKPEFKSISAILYANYDCCNYERKYTLIHNPLATNKLELNFIPVDREYHVIDFNSDDCQLVMNGV